ncbi:hypothetical protein TrST_g1494 [Triparma strigata]|nr:hypothetical protein TrST_g1494 [Triparma strigata]
MKEIFGKGKLKADGTEGAIIEMPSIEEMQRREETREAWISYAAFDAEGTWRLYMELKRRLEKKEWKGGKSLMDFYNMYMVDFGLCLTDMERRGVRVDTDYLHNIEIKAKEDQKRHTKIFKEWARKMMGVDGLAINPSSSQQLQTFLFGGSTNQKTGEPVERVREFKVPRDELSEEALEAYRLRDLSENDSVEIAETDELDKMSAVQLKQVLKENKLKMSGKKDELKERLRGHFLKGGKIDSYEVMTVQELKDSLTARGLPTTGNKPALIKRLKEDSAFALELMQASEGSVDGYKTVGEALEAAAKRGGGSSELAKILAEVKGKSLASKYVDVSISSIFMTPNKFTAGGAPSVTADVLRGLAGTDPSNGEYGSAYKFFGGGEVGHEACIALYSLTQIGSIETMINNFVMPLQNLADDQSRVHCSLNMNTETGRLSARKPNLQNQPALEKDQYQIRKAFQASPGNKLIVADYGQLELRLLASMTDCTSMIDAFEQGGDFHSRTAMGMFPYIKERVERGEVLFEFDYSGGKTPDKPMLKDEYASERRKAKTLNFSIAYGKTAHGLSKDWGVSVPEAEAMLQAWYSDRPEVEKWQRLTKKTARTKGITRTLMGRYRELPEALSGDRKLIGHAERASINTPIQGGAADVAMVAMIKINKSPILKKLGWILLLQVHDEVMLEGPEETAEEAFKEVIKLMENPWDEGLEKTKVPLLVDGSYADNWYEAK